MVRQKNMYRLVDMVMHISPMDQVAEKESFPFIKYYKLLRMPIRAFRILNKNTPAQERSFLRTANIGFIGDGRTPTNHLGIQWYLENCWEARRRRGRTPPRLCARGVPRRRDVCSERSSARRTCGGSCLGCGCG